MTDKEGVAGELKPAMVETIPNPNRNPL